MLSERQKKQEMSHVGLSDRYKEFNHSNVQAGGRKQAFISARMDFTIHCPLLIKESPALLKVNDSAAITASYVLQMMRLLIGL